LPWQLRSLLKVRSRALRRENVGAIVNPGSSGAINGNGALASSLATIDSWANISD
jgi:hypothetical protein